MQLRKVLRLVRMYLYPFWAGRSIQAEVQDAMKLIQDPEALKAAVKGLFQKYACGEASPTVSEDAVQTFQRYHLHALMLS